MESQIEHTQPLLNRIDMDHPALVNWVCKQIDDFYERPRSQWNNWRSFITRRAESESMTARIDPATNTVVDLTATDPVKYTHFILKYSK